MRDRLVEPAELLQHHPQRRMRQRMVGVLARDGLQLDSRPGQVPGVAELDRGIVQFVGGGHRRRSHGGSMIV